MLPYIRRFISLGYGILDVNIPSHIFPDPNSNFPSNENPAFIVNPTTKFLETQTKELLCYLWDNYLEAFESRSIVLMGVGDAYLGVKQLLTSRGISLPLISSPLFSPYHEFHSSPLFFPETKHKTKLKTRLQIQNRLHPLLRLGLPAPRQIRNRPPSLLLVQAKLTYLRFSGPFVLVG